MINITITDYGIRPVITIDKLKLDHDYQIISEGTNERIFECTRCGAQKIQSIVTCSNCNGKGSMSHWHESDYITFQSQYKPSNNRCPICGRNSTYFGIYTVYCRRCSQSFTEIRTENCQHWQGVTNRDDDLVPNCVTCSTCGGTGKIYQDI